MTDDGATNGSGLVLSPLLSQTLAGMPTGDDEERTAEQLAQMWRQANVDAFCEWLGDQREQAIAAWMEDLQLNNPHERANAIVALARAGAVEARGAIAELRGSTTDCMYDDMQPLVDYGRRFGIEVDVSMRATIEGMSFQRIDELENLAATDQIPGRHIMQGRHATTLGALAEWADRVLEKVG